MAEEREASETELPPPFLEVICKSSGETRRFAPGVKAGFALSFINQKVEPGNPLGFYIEAAKEGEEPIIFGPDSVLVSYGSGWKLQTVVESGGLMKFSGIQSLKPSLSPGSVSQPAISFVYIAKILLAFIFIILLAAVFTLALENLPRSSWNLDVFGILTLNLAGLEDAWCSTFLLNDLVRFLTNFVCTSKVYLLAKIALSPNSFNCRKLIPQHQRNRLINHAYNCCTSLLCFPKSSKVSPAICGVQQQLSQLCKFKQPRDLPLGISHDHFRR
ncbi:hypothetical protein Ancab_015165 [Ancistrocladus abbreviatus]